MLRERFEDTAQPVPPYDASQPTRAVCDLLIARYRCSGRGDLRCPCLANTAASAERMVRNENAPT